MEYELRLHLQVDPTKWVRFKTSCNKRGNPRLESLGKKPQQLMYIYIYAYVWGPQAFLKHAQPGHRTNRTNQTELREAALAAFISQLKRGGYGIWFWNMALVDYGYGYGSGCG